MKRIDVNIISGFLGSGKTTAILNLIKEKPKNENWAIIINEFGKISIDSLILKEGAEAEDIFEIAGGCICCSSKDLFESHLEDIIKTKKPDRILIEPTGLGGLQMVKDIIWDFEELRLLPIICLVDVNSFKNPRLKINQIYLSQIRDSDIVFISKCDTENSEEKAEELIYWIKDIFPPKLHYGKSENGILGKGVLNTPSNKIEEGKSKAPSIVGVIDKEDEYLQESFSFVTSKRFSLKLVREFFQQLPHLVRAKGFLNTDIGWIKFNAVMNNFSYSLSAPKEENILVLIRNSEQDKEANLGEKIETLVFV